MKATLVLEDGSSFEGLSVGNPGEIAGEVVLNTSVVGYQEMITDPANAGKILVLTYPLIGNYGVAKKFNESKKCWISGLIIKELSRIYSNFQAEGSLKDFLIKEEVVAASDIDTRTLAVTIRDKGEMFGIISTNNATKDELLHKLKNCKDIKLDTIKNISVKKPFEIKGASNGADIAVIDLGITNSCIKQLTTLGCNITMLPYSTKAGDILALKPDGIIVSNGPENDSALSIVTATVKELMGKIPMMGISTGHMVIGSAAGAKFIKMKIGHRGSNYPVKPADCLKGEITVQNHSYVIAEDSIKSKRNIAVTLRNVNDSSIEEIESKTLKFISTQYIPVSPGFDEVNIAFVKFLKMIGKPLKIKNNIRYCREAEYAKT